MSSIEGWVDRSRRITLHPLLRGSTYKEKYKLIPKLTGRFKASSWNEVCVKHIRSCHAYATSVASSSKGVSEVFFYELYTKYPRTYKKFCFFGRDEKFFNGFSKHFNAAVLSNFCVKCASNFSSNKSLICRLCAIEDPDSVIQASAELRKISMKEAFADGTIIEKRTRHLQETHGVSNVFQLESVKKKRVESLKKKFGDDWQQHLIDKKNKSVKERYGVDCVLQDPEVRSKCMQTNIERFGVPHAMQNKDIFIKSMANSHRIREFRYRGRSYKVQSSSEKRLFRRLVRKYGINSVHTQFHEEFPDYIFSEAGTFPDFYIDSEDIFVECKSVWTLYGKESWFEDNRRKARDVEKSGNVMEWMVHHKTKSKRHCFLKLPGNWYEFSLEELQHLVNSFILRKEKQWLLAQA